MEGSGTECTVTGTLNNLLCSILATLEETADWEKELQQELQEYEVVTDNKDDQWDQEIEKMLQADDS